MIAFAVGVVIGLTLGLAITALIARAMWSRIEAIAVLTAYTQGVKHEREGFVVVNPFRKRVPAAFEKAFRR